MEAYIMGADRDECVTAQSYTSYTSIFLAAFRPSTELFGPKWRSTSSKGLTIFSLSQ